MCTFTRQTRLLRQLSAALFLARKWSLLMVFRIHFTQHSIMMVVQFEEVEVKKWWLVRRWRCKLQRHSQLAFHPIKIFAKLWIGLKSGKHNSSRAVHVKFHCIQNLNGKHWRHWGALVPLLVKCTRVAYREPKQLRVQNCISRDFFVCITMNRLEKYGNK